MKTIQKFSQDSGSGQDLKWQPCEHKAEENYV